jgi:hypothetical protein
VAPEAELSVGGTKHEKGATGVLAPAANHTDARVDDTASITTSPCIRWMIALALLIGAPGPALAGNQGDLILNEFSAVADTDFLRGAVETYVDADVDLANDEIEINNHVYYDQQGPVALTSTGALPTGLLLDTDYYIVTTGLTNTPAGDWIGLALTPGGAKVDITGTGFGTHSITLPSELGDPFLGVVRGNGGNWFELVVIADHLDIRGWTLEWTNADPDGGTIGFQQHAIWSDLRSGTIITIREDDLSPPGFGVLLTDLSYDPENGDWWIHANVDDFTVLSQNGFKTDDDDWRMRILDEGLSVIQDYIGEGTALWGGGGGVGNDEVGKLEQDPSAAAATAPPVPAYNDGTTSTFGAPNRWSMNTMEQDFSTLRAVATPPVPSLTSKAAVLLASLIVGSGLWLGRRRMSVG